MHGPLLLPLREQSVQGLHEVAPASDAKVPAGHSTHPATCASVSLVAGRNVPGGHLAHAMSCVSSPAKDMKWPAGQEAVYGAQTASVPLTSNEGESLAGTFS